MTETKTRSTRQRVALILLGGVILLLLVGLFNFVRHRMHYALTNAVFVASDSLTNVGFDRVKGQLVTLKKQEGERVAVGELLAQLDDSHYRLALQGLDAELAAQGERRAALGLKRQRLAEEFKLQRQLAGREIERLKNEKLAQGARITSLDVVVEQLQRDQQRLQNLYQQQAIARQRLEKLETELESKKAEGLVLKRQSKALDSAIASAQIKRQLVNNSATQLAEIDRQLAGSAQQIQQLQAGRDSARQDLDATALRSPISGRIAKRLVGDHANLAAGQPVYALINPQDLYLIALLEENKLDGVLPGALVNIQIDAYPNQSWQGKVEWIMPASAATFALAPRDISAGEFTKVAQRIPVRIQITEGPLDKLRVGLGGEVEIRRQDG
ncbi:MAG: HlyD family efflux transporter periplasmic adaptor subunit [Geopsychrobacter sp.]|nr:HlyD family efflux transporter periplasmic adaptor subunit [Geopsychrobacter sp.]